MSRETVYVVSDANQQRTVQEHDMSDATLPKSVVTLFQDSHVKRVVVDFGKAGSVEYKRIRH